MARQLRSETRPFRFPTVDDDDSSDGSGDSIQDDVEPLIDPCVKLNLPENIVAYIEKYELIRDADPISCDSGLVEKVMSNYIIAKKILSNLCWRDKFLCKHVCTTWRSAVNALAKEQLNPVDFVYDLMRVPMPDSNTFRKSDNFSIEPLLVLNFINTSALNTALECADVSPCLCKTPCQNKWHCMVDVIQQNVCAPKDCMLTLVACSLTYLPLPQSDTDKHAPAHPIREDPFYSGVCIPVIPNVKCHVINIKQRKKNTMDLQKDFYDVVNKLSQDQIIKGVLVFVTDKYILQTVEDIMFLNYFKDVQPDIPYALGGCIIEETMSGQKDMETLISRINSKVDFVSENLISIALFTVPKTSDTDEQGDKCNFDMFSLIIESSEWTKQKIQQAINDFAKNVPHYEYSAAFKLSCVGRDRKHLLEQDYFRAAFPQTPIFGCYGNGELGINHPPRPPPEEVPHRMKRHKGEPGTQSLMYSYSTVFVYVGWGKQATPDPETPKKAT